MRSPLFSTTPDMGADGLFSIWRCLSAFACDVIVRPSICDVGTRRLGAALGLTPITSDTDVGGALPLDRMPFVRIVDERERDGTIMEDVPVVWPLDTEDPMSNATRSVAIPGIRTKSPSSSSEATIDSVSGARASASTDGMAIAARSELGE